MKLIKTDWRSRLTDDSLSDLMVIKLDSPDVQEFDPNPALAVWMEKKRMPEFNDRESRSRREAEEELDPDVVERHDAVAVALPLAVVPGPSTEYVNDEEDVMSDYWTDDEIDEEQAYKLLTSL